MARTAHGIGRHGPRLKAPLIPVAAKLLSMKNAPSMISAKPSRSPLENGPSPATSETNATNQPIPKRRATAFVRRRNHGDADAPFGSVVARESLDGYCWSSTAEVVTLSLREGRLNTGITCEGLGPFARTSSGSFLCSAARRFGLPLSRTHDIESLGPFLV